MQYYKGEKNISDIINNTTKKLFKKKGFNIFKLISVWKEIITAEYLEYTNPINLKQVNSYKKILEIEVTNSAVIFDLQYGKDMIISDINNFFQQELVTELKFILREEEYIAKPQQIKAQTSNSKIINPELAKQISLITDEELKSELIKIAQKFD
jgi:hypothetical protein